MIEPWAVVLGASEGTGAAICRAAATRAGLDVFGAHRGNHAEGAAEVAQAVRAAGRRVHMHVADAGTAEGAESGADAVRAAIGAGGRVKLFVHSIANASLGRFTSGGREQFHPKQVAKTFDSMAHSFVYWTQALLARDLLAPGARLLALTNPMPENLVHGLGLASAAKGALAVYVRHLAAELGPRGHRVNLLRFGLVETTAIHRVLRDGTWAEVKRRIESVTPARRLATVDEVAAFVALLVGDACDGFNGATIDLSGGQSQSLLDPYFNVEDYP